MDLSTAGVKLAYCVETTAGTRPTTGYTNIDGVKSIPGYNQEPNQLDSTTLAATEYKTYVAGLKDISGSQAYGFNLSDDLLTAWGTLVSAYTTGKASSKATWFAVVIPGMTKAFFFTGEPSPMGLGSIGVDAVLETEAYITTNSIHGWDTKPTIS